MSARNRTLGKDARVPRQILRSNTNQSHLGSLSARVLATAAVAVLLLVGCNGKADSDGSSSKSGDKQSQVHPQLDGSQVRDRVLAAYKNANAYSDKASLSLSYRLQGSYLEEPHPWEVRFDRQRGFELDAYEARIKADANQLSCFIYDFSSGNLDDQWQVHPVLAAGSALSVLPRLFQDGICRHYLTGQHDLPINNELKLAGEALFPPTAALLSGENLPAWLACSTATRGNDLKQGKSTSIQLQLSHLQMKWTVAVDPNTFLMQSITFPNDLLDSRLKNNPEVADLVVKAQFNEASLSPKFQPNTFKSITPARAKLVRRFVAVPEPFPSNHIGTPVDGMLLRDVSGTELGVDSWKSKVTLLWWMSDNEDITAIPQLTEIVSGLSPKEFNIARVRSVHGVLPSNLQALTQLKEEAKQHSIPLMADFGFSAGRAIGLQQYPMLAVLDRDGVLQYVKSLDPKEPVTVAEIKGLLDRVRNGDNVAQEMRDEYESFLDVYHERLAQVKADDMLTTRSAPTMNNGARPVAFNNTQLRTTILPTSTNLTQPGNICIANDGDGVSSIVLDGWRTLTRLNPNGKQGTPTTLDLDDQESISIIKTGRQKTGQLIVYSEMGSAVRLLNSDLKVQKIVETQNAQQRIRSAELVDIDGDGHEEVVVAFTGSRGVVAFDVDSDRSRTICREPVRSFVLIRTAKQETVLVYSNQAANLKAISLAGQGTTATDIPCDLVTATKVCSGIDTNGNYSLCVIGTDKQGEWNAVGMSDSFQKKWQHRIGSQRFSLQTESVQYAHVCGAKTGLWAIATADESNPRIHLISDGGKMFETTQLYETASILGIDIASDGKQYLLQVSDGSNVQSWNVTAPAAVTRSTSSSQ